MSEWIPDRYRFADAAAVLCAQHVLPEERNVPAQHIISMQDASTLPNKQLVNKEAHKNLINGP